jgi:RNA polymerase sigma factor (sigma-70 family)
VSSSSTEFTLETTQITGAINELTSDEQDAVRLIICEGKSYEHAAESLNVSVTTINNWKHRGLSKLRKFAEKSTSMITEDALATG